jgi:hypothetical protein
VARDRPFKLPWSSKFLTVARSKPGGRTNGSFVNYGRDLVPASLDNAIEEAIEKPAGEWDISSIAIFGWCTGPQDHREGGR